MFQIKAVGKIKTRFLFSNFFRISCRLGVNVEKCGGTREATDKNIVRHMRFACWTTKATDRNSEYVIRNGFSTATMVMGKRCDVTLYLRCLCVWSVHVRVALLVPRNHVRYHSSTNYVTAR